MDASQTNTNINAKKSMIGTATAKSQLRGKSVSVLRAATSRSAHGNGYLCGLSAPKGSQNRNHRDTMRGVYSKLNLVGKTFQAAQAFFHQQDRAEREAGAETD